MTVPWAATHRFDVLHPSDTIDTVVFVDGLGRVVQQKSDGALFTGATSPAANVMRVSGRVTFDDFGRVVAVHYPVTEPIGTPGRFNAAVDGVAPTRLEHDVLDRPISVTRPDGVASSRAFGFGADRGVVRASSSRGTLRRGRGTVGRMAALRVSHDLRKPSSFASA